MLFKFDFMLNSWPSLFLSANWLLLMLLLLVVQKSRVFMQISSKINSLVNNFIAVPWLVLKR